VSSLCTSPLKIRSGSTRTAIHIGIENMMPA